MTVCVCCVNSFKSKDTITWKLLERLICFQIQIMAKVFQCFVRRKKKCLKKEVPYSLWNIIERKLISWYEKIILHQKCMVHKASKQSNWVFFCGFRGTDLDLACLHFTYCMPSQCTHCTLKTWFVYFITWSYSQLINKCWNTSCRFRPLL